MVEVGLTLVVMVFQPLSLRLEAFLSFKYKEKEKKATDNFCVLIHKSNRNIIVPFFNKFLSYELDPR